jgi:hypothetical protein
MCIIRPTRPALNPDHAHQEACRTFIESIQQRNGISLDPFDRDVWGEGADSTLDQSN